MKREASKGKIGACRHLARARVSVWMGALVLGVICAPANVAAQRPIPEGARVTIPSGARGTPQEVRLLSFGLQQPDADSLAQRLLEQAEARHGAMSLEAADAIDLLVWVINSSQFLYSPLGTPRNLNRVQPLVARALAIRDSLLDPDDPGRAASLDNMAAAARTAGDRERADSLARTSLAIRIRAYGESHPEVARSLRLLGYLAYADSSYEEAEDLCEQALEIQDRTLAPNDLDLLPTLNWLVLTHQETGAWEDTIQIARYQRGLEIAEARLGPRQLLTLYCMGGLAQVMGAVDPDEAERLFKRAIQAADEVLGPRNLITFRDYTDYADLLMGRGDPDSAVRLLRRVAHHYSDSAFFLMMLGASLGAAGDYEEAIAVLTRGVAAAERPRSLRFLPLILTERGSDYMSLGGYVEARRDLDRARAIFEAMDPLNGDAAKIYPNTLALLAELKTRMGEFAEARELFERMIAAQERARVWTELVAWRHTAYGSALARMGDRDAALQQLQLARDLFKKSTPPENGRSLDNLYAMGELYLERGSNGPARESFERCLAIQEDKLGADHPIVARTLTGLARLELAEGKLEAARAELERAIALIERTYGLVHPQAAQSLGLLAQVELAAGNNREALAAALQSEEASREHVRLTARAVSERRALAYAEARGSELGYVLAVAETEPEVGAVSRAWDAVMRSRGLVLDELATRRRSVVVTADAVAESLANELRWARNRLSNLAVRGFGNPASGQASGVSGIPATPEYLQKTCEEALQRKEWLEEALAERSLEFRQARERVAAGYEEVVAALPSDAALVAFVRHDVPTTPGGAGNPDERSRYSAFVCCAGESRPTLIALGGSGEIDSLVARWREWAGPRRVLAPDSEERYRKLSGALRQKIWDPLASRVAGARRVFVVPDGALNLVSLAALPSSDGRYLVEAGPTFHYLSAERDLAGHEERPAGVGGMLAIGGPSFNEESLFAALRAPGASDSVRVVTPDDLPRQGELVAYAAIPSTRTAKCASFRDLNFKALPSTEREVEEVAGLWMKPPDQDQRVSEATGSGERTQGRRAEVLTGAEASESAFKSKAPRYRMLHVSTHGFFLGGECRSVIERTRGVGPAVATANRLLPDVGENPLLLSGLALAGANHHGSAGPGEDDGILTAEEIASLDLTGVEWAVLSACGTGLGEVRAGEGVFGLRRAFQVAGARTLVMSLWDVGDEPTRQWMGQLYRARLEDGLDTAESVRQASLAVLAERRAKGESTHPFYWGAFVAAGDWR